MYVFLSREPWKCAQLSQSKYQKFPPNLPNQGEVKRQGVVLYVPVLVCCLHFSVTTTEFDNLNLMKNSDESLP